MHAFPTQHKKVCLIAVALRANANSSDRDALNLSRLCHEKWNATCYILTDNQSLEADFAEVQVVSSRIGFLESLNLLVLNESKLSDILFCISAHGYQTTHQGHRDQLIRVKGEEVLDHDIRDWFYRSMHEQCLSLTLVDTCHSGTMLDLPFLSEDGKNYKCVETDLIIKPRSFCISACHDNELAGEDISIYGGYGGKLVCSFLDFFNSNLSKSFFIEHFFQHVRTVFSNQVRQKSHPLLTRT